jgi:hypothetical protein
MGAIYQIPFLNLARTMLLSMGLAACVSLPPSPRPVLTADLYAFFKPCAPSEGAHALQLSKEGQLIGNAEVQWLAASGDNWDIEVNNNFGQRLGLWSLKQKSPSSQMVKLHKESNILKKLPPVELDPQGFVHVDGNRVALKGDEISCILGGYAPLPWASSLILKRSEDGGQTLEFQEPDRSMEVSITPTGGTNGQEVKLCTRVQWSRFIFWQQEMAWCALRLKKTASSNQQTIRGEYPQVRLIELTFRGYEDYSLRLIPLEDPKTSSTFSSEKNFFTKK